MFEAMPEYHLDYIGEHWNEETFKQNMPADHSAFFRQFVKVNVGEAARGRRAVRSGSFPISEHRRNTARSDEHRIGQVWAFTGLGRTARRPRGSAPRGQTAITAMRGDVPPRRQPGELLAG